MQLQRLGDHKACCSIRITLPPLSRRSACWSAGQHRYRCPLDASSALRAASACKLNSIRAVRVRHSGHKQLQVASLSFAQLVRGFARISVVTLAFVEASEAGSSASASGPAQNNQVIHSTAGSEEELQQDIAARAADLQAAALERQASNAAASTSGHDHGDVTVVMHELEPSAVFSNASTNVSAGRTSNATSSSAGPAKAVIKGRGKPVKSSQRQLAASVIADTDTGANRPDEQWELIGFFRPKGPGAGQQAVPPRKQLRFAETLQQHLAARGGQPVHLAPRKKHQPNDVATR